MSKLSTLQWCSPCFFVLSADPTPSLPSNSIAAEEYCAYNLNCSTLLTLQWQKRQAVLKHLQGQVRRCQSRKLLGMRWNKRAKGMDVIVSWCLQIFLWFVLRRKQSNWCSRRFFVLLPTKSIFALCVFQKEHRDNLFGDKAAPPPPKSPRLSPKVCKDEQVSCWNNHTINSLLTIAQL